MKTQESKVYLAYSKAVEDNCLDSKQLSSTALELALRVSVPTNRSEVKLTCPQKGANLLAHMVMKETHR